eukprot:CAMPEP_0177739676 /NCGR_PEP_ID=MMETSP0484_2-20121128/27154_1 /TAXON_ID=354590 /ORGANISM="Rhodomonas lens, Strain RHODO" /LENGTH=243 /DNA_ID=CAMNT_0019253757 /DNA_START=9 /DNA_END=740 /DNA_ORIENTATION=-
MPVLVVLDFDFTVIDVNSDTFVVEKLSTETAQAMQRLKEASKENQWTAGMDREMACLHQRGVSIDQIESCLASVPIEPALKGVLTDLSSKDVEFRVLSDANTMFIEVILKANGLDQAVSRIVTNPSSVSDGRLRVSPYHTTPHPPPSTSPPNLCKGRVMREWLQEKDWSNVIYCGDGGGDFEGALAVPAGGTVCARKDWSLHKKLQQRMAEGGAQGLAASVELWQTQAELAARISARARARTA